MGPSLSSPQWAYTRTPLVLLGHFGVGLPRVGVGGEQTFRPPPRNGGLPESPGSCLVRLGAVQGVTSQLRLQGA